jgi:hypothetical protein
MSLRHLVIKMIAERGCGTVDHLEPELSKHGYTRKQIITALNNARTLGKLWSEGRASKKGMPRDAYCPAVYWPGKKLTSPMYAQLMQAKKPKPERPLVASVWDWGTPQPESAWPKELQGRVYAPLGPWNTEETV